MSFKRNSSKYFINCLGIFLFGFILVLLGKVYFLQKRLDIYENPKPSIIIGIVSSQHQEASRNLQRKTWIQSIKKLGHQIPYQIKYTFLLDKKSIEIYRENSIFHDIFIVESPLVKNKPVSSREKLHAWFEHVYTYYSDVDLIMKINSDAFVCVPEMFQFIQKISSPNLYFTDNTNVSSTNIEQNNLYDDKFVVFSKKIFDQLSRPKYLQKYDDIDLHKLNNKNSPDILYDVQLPFCDDNLLLNNAEIKMMKLSNFDKIRHLGFNSYTNECKNVLPIERFVGIECPDKDELSNLEKIKGYENKMLSDSAVSGYEFIGDIVRQTPDIFTSNLPLLGITDMIKTNCKKWAVLSTIFGVQESLKHLVTLNEWCTVVIADLKSLPKKEFLQQFGEANLTLPFLYLTVDDQIKLYPAVASYLPKNNYGRKNIGYLFAMHHGAEEIWDFDDDNIGVIPEKKFEFVKPCENFTSVFLNPYPYFGSKETYVWPRGFPLQQIRNYSSIPDVCEHKGDVNIGMIQSLANNEPDIDAIFRLTRTTPFYFTKEVEQTKLLVVPSGSFSPLNAQASLWFPDSFAYMMLPITVSGRVADIWRGYIVEYFLYHIKDSHVVFSPPFVIQNRTVHNLMKDFNAELGLYQQSRQLIILLSSYNGSETLPSLYTELYKRKYIESEDVNLANLWHKTIVAICEQTKSKFCSHL